MTVIVLLASRFLLTDHTLIDNRWSNRGIAGAEFRSKQCGWSSKSNLASCVSTVQVTRNMFLSC